MDMWLEEAKRDEGIGQQSYDRYKGELDASDDKRAKKDVIKLRPALGNLRVWEADAGRLDDIQSIAAAGLKSKARLHKVILTGIMGLAVRYGVLTENPVRDTSRMRRRKSRPQTIERDRLDGLRAQLREWLAGKGIPGTPAYTRTVRNGIGLCSTSPIWSLAPECGREKRWRRPGAVRPRSGPDDVYCLGDRRQAHREGIVSAGVGEIRCGVPDCHAAGVHDPDAEAVARRPGPRANV
ncbi:hypothetical protein NDR87_34810 [Nocardia sp. CDC159]|uniref:Core-binding (CB) domain-containing protein n=1 Tax=Nocardia pulmonis TaxID=2951408 RepID=A0A9X2EI57_9NOCA|nr:MULTISPECIES: hypothetical protein [Nocardia]MCM6778663.1 hypothetical protein [Nocardia pulmonis]MCM6791552.1 hypothetical protein [Nocardia sp. CDC159]